MSQDETQKTRHTPDSSASESRKRGLGRGLANLLSSTVPEKVSKKLAGLSVIEMPLDDIKPMSHQPRENFDEQRLEELMASIRQHGVLQPIIVSRGSDGFRVIAGERRFRAAKMAGLTSVPAIVKEEKHSRTELFELALIENIQRADLSPIEEAKAYQVLLDANGWSQDELARRLGKDRSSIANTIRLLKLHPNVLSSLERGAISVGHAKVLCSVPFERQLLFYQKIKDQKTSVRALEDLIQSKFKKKTSAAKKKGRAKAVLDPQYEVMRKKVQDKLGARVIIQAVHRNRGAITIEYPDIRILNQILERLSGH